MKSQLFLIAGLLILFTACKKNKRDDIDKLSKNNLETVIDFNKVISDYNTWYSYHYHKINLSSDFIPIGTNNDTIEKDFFLKHLNTGDYITIELKSKDSLVKYKLFKLPKDVNKSIKSTIKNTSITTYNYYQMEGINFPEFNFIDINGNNYNNEQLKGKTTVLKTWFISCVPCVAEIPELNNLVDRFRENDDFQFISLATDEKLPLTNFLERKEFKYVVVPNQREFIQEKLNSKIYPTHMIIDENGVIRKVVNRAIHMISYLENTKVIEYENIKKNLAPPPPPPPPIQNKNGA